MIVALSDTHVGDRAKTLPPYLLETLNELRPELIIHAGDVTSAKVLETLEEIAPVVVVRGNADHLDLPEEIVIELDNLKVGVIHGHQFLSLNTQSLSLKALEMDVELLIFGHTHRRYFDFYHLHGRSVYLLNPGSPTFPRFDYPSFAVIKPSKEPSVRWVTLP